MSNCGSVQLNTNIIMITKQPGLIFSLRILQVIFSDYES